MTISEGTCWECGAGVEEDARFCRVCGALTPQTTQRPWRMLVGISVAGVLVLVAALLLGGGDQAPGDPALEESAVSTAAPAPSTTVAAEPVLGPVRAADVVCSVELPDYPCHALIDGDSTTAWNAPGGGEGAEIRVRFESSVRLTTVVFHNLDGEEALMRNGRARMIEVHLTDSGAVTSAELDPGHGPYRVTVPPDPTASLVIHILSTYPGEHFAGQEAFEELALQELTFAGITTAP